MCSDRFVPLFQFKKLSLELGGKNATVVFADCDWDLSVKGAVRAAFTNQGQVCLAGSRVLIEESIYDKFVAAMVEEVKKVRTGGGGTQQEQASKRWSTNSFSSIHLTFIAVHSPCCLS